MMAQAAVDRGAEDKPINATESGGTLTKNQSSAATEENRNTPKSG